MQADKAWVRRLPTAVCVGAASAIAATQLLFAPVVGLANNGDFERVMGYVGFQYMTDDRSEKYFSWIVTKFAFGPPGWFRSGLVTSETLLAWIARLVSQPFAPLFDLRVLGAIHAALLVTGLGLLVSAAEPLGRSAQWVAAALLVFFFTDVGYVAPLNSFYSQAASLVFLLLTLGVAARSIAFRRRSPAPALIFFLLAALFTGSKPQEAVQGVLLAAFGLRLYWQTGRSVVRQPAAWLAAGLLAFSAWYLRATPPAISDVARYHKVFMELLPSSPDPAGDLRDLGLDPAWVSASGKIAYQPGPFSDPAFREAFLSRFSYARLVRFYLTHPGRLASTLAHGGEQALRLRHPRFGNFEHRPGVAPGTKSAAFSAWSDARLRLPGHAWIWIAFLLAGNLAFAAVLLRRSPPGDGLAAQALVLLVAMAATAFLVCVLSNAHGDLPRTLYVFHALCDLMVAADVTYAVRRRRDEPTSASPSA
jgi:hypothetical protein